MSTATTTSPAPVVWFTGLPCSGKTTLAKALSTYLQNKNISTSHLDGDEVRELLPQTGFSLEERSRHLQSIAFTARKLSEHGILVTASFVSPTNEQRAMIRKLCPNLILIFVNTPLSLCEKRDVKGMYKLAREGKIKDFTGIDSPFDLPDIVDLKIDTSERAVGSCLEEILDLLRNNGLKV